MLTPVPESLSISWSDGASYYFDNVFDGSSLVWIGVMIDTFNEMYPEHYWSVDDPGTLYNDDDAEWVDDADESPYDLERLQDITNVALDRYSHVFDKLVEMGVDVVSEND